MNDSVRKVIEEKAKTGQGSLHPYTEDDLSLLDELIVVPAQLSNPPLDVDVVDIDLSVRIGEERQVSNPVTFQTPIFIGEIPRDIGMAARKALAYGAALSGTISNVSDHISAEENEIAKDFGGYTIAHWSPLRSVALSDLRSADLIEIVLRSWTGNRFQTHVDMEAPSDLEKHVEILREITGYSCPIIARVNSGNIYDDTRIAIESQVDAIVVDGGFYLRSFGMPTYGVFGPASKAFRDTKAKEAGIKLMVIGDFFDGIDIFKALALGADIVGLHSAPLAAISYVDGGEEGNWNTDGKKLANYLRATTEELQQTTALCSCRSVEEITSDNLRATSYESAAIMGVKLIGYDRLLPKWLH